MEFHKTLDWAYSMTLTYRFAAVPKKYEHIDFTPPKSVAEAAAKGLEYRQKASPSNKGGLTPAEAAKQGIGSGVQRAVNLKNRDTISPEVIKQMRNFLSRAKKNSKIAPEHKAEPWNDKGYVAWLLWGGDPAVAWVDKIIGQMESADNKESKKAGFHKIIKPSGRIASTTGDGSGVGFFIPLSADLASQYGVKPEDTSPPHVTFLYVGKVASEQVPTLLRVAREVLQDTPPVFGVLNGVDSFVQEDKNQRVLYSRVVFSYDLKPLRDRLWAALTEAGFKVEQAFPNFTPHVTIEYRDGVNDAVLDSTHPSGSWDCRTIEVWGLPKKYAISLGKSGVARTASVLDLFGYGTLTTEMESVSVQPSPSFPVALSELPYDSFPENSSETTREELQFLMDLQIRVRPYMAQQIADTDPDPTFYLWRYCREQGLDPFNTLDAAKSVTPTIVQLKRFYNRARPYQLAIPLGFADFHPLTSTTAQTPAYPSGHTIQATLAALLLSDIYPEHSVKFAALARQVSLCRMAGGFHFPSDVFYGEQIAKAIHRGASLRVAKAKYKEKKQVPKTDGSGKTTVYVYSERQVANRQRQKAERLEDFKPALADLRKQVKSDLDSDDPKKGLIALAVGLIDATYERVGNEDSADNGHYGVTGWLRKHVTFKGNKAVIRYVGKSGVKHEKTVEDDALVGALKNCCEDKEKDEPLLSLGKHSVTADDVNKYLEPYGITAKDLRGLHANREMQNRLRKIRSEGPKLPRLRKERDPILKQEFKEALEGAAEAVGHEPATLRKQYLVPGIEEAYMKDGTVTRDLTTSARIATSVRRVPTSSLRLDPSVRAFFKRFAALFDAYPNLWVEGGGARDALLTFYADRAEGYERATRSMRDIDLVLIGGTLADKAQLLRQFGGVIKAEDLDIRAASLGQYFKTRDVGINEVALRPEVMVFTTKAVNDLVRGTVNPSGGEFDPKWQDFTPRVGLRSVLFALREGLDFPTNPMLREAVAAARPFDLLIHLYKAFDTGVEDEFYAVVRDNPHLSGTRSAEEALLALSKRVYDFDRTPSQQRTYDDARSLVFGDRWEQEGLRFATKSDAEREDEEAERLLKPEPKHKPPRNDLRRRRVQDTTENDPDAKQDAKDRSQNYKDAALAFLPLAVL
jgi:DNA topoisomerase IB/2'-5' RNA ligase